MEKLRVNMFAKGDNVPGQGVGSAYHEQVALLKEYAKDDLVISINKTKKGDIYHFNTVDPVSYLRLRRSHVPTVMHVHFLPDTLDGSIKLPHVAGKFFSAYVMDFYRRADHLVVVNPTFIKELTAYGLPKEKITYIPNYVSREFFHPLSPADSDRCRKKLNLENAPFTVLGVGQVQTRKGVKDFIDVAHRLPDIQFIWCGGFSFGKITDGYDELKKAVEQAPKNLKFTGIIPREQMNEYYNMANCLFLPSYNELFPMAILEACNIHLPILVRDLDLYEEILLGKYYKAKDNEGFANEIKKIASDASYYEIGRRNSEEIENFYSPDHVSKMWVAYYRSIAGPKEKA